MDLESKSRSAHSDIDNLEAQHRQYAQQLESLTQKPYLSEDEQIEEVRLKNSNSESKIRSPPNGA